MGKLVVLMVTAFVDMVGLLIILPLLPFYALEFGGEGLAVGILVAAYAVAQLASAPLWGRVSDRFGRRPAILISLGASVIAYIVFAFATTLWLLLLSRLVQGAGGGTPGVVQAYVADSTEPENRTRALGWLSAATSLGVMVGPALGSFAATWGMSAPGLVAAGLCLTNMVFAWRYLRESHDVAGARASEDQPRRSGQAVWHVLTSPREPGPRLIWIYGLGMTAFQGMVAVLALFLALRFGVTERTIGFVFLYTGLISLIARALLLGWTVDRLGEVRLSRVGCLLLAAGLIAIPFTTDFVALALVLALVPLGMSFTFPCVTAMLSQIVGKHERGLFMGVQQSFGGVARSVGPIGAGWMWDHWGTGTPFWVGAVLVGVALALTTGMGRYAAAGRSKPAQRVAPG